MQKNETEPFPYTVHKNKIKMDKDLNARPDTIEFLDKNITSMLFDIGLSNISLGMSPQARAKKEKK